MVLRGGAGAVQTMTIGKKKHRLPVTRTLVSLPDPSTPVFLVTGHSLSLSLSFLRQDPVGSQSQVTSTPLHRPSIPSVQRTAAPQVKAADDDSDSVAPHPRAAARPDLLDSSSNYLQTNTNDDNPHTPDDDD
ncbi:hypothetical protein CGCF413_v004694 [Colletotrichum fructicola]|nr:hypothetical protein CGCF413_v004694 [Colletotrichum fructicola]